MFFRNLHLLLKSPELLLIIEILSGSIKIYFLLFLFQKAAKSEKIQKHLILLLMVLLCGFIVDFSWIVVLISSTLLPFIDFRYTLFIVRIAWGINYILFLSLIVVRKDLRCCGFVKI
jgi:membrane-associated HD superfamily phosphohydrolase